MELEVGGTYLTNFGETRKLLNEVIIQLAKPCRGFGDDRGGIWFADGWGAGRSNRNHRLDRRVG